MKHLLAFAAGAVLAGGVVYVGMRPNPPVQSIQTSQPPLLDLSESAAASVAPAAEPSPPRPRPKPLRPFEPPPWEQALIGVAQLPPPPRIDPPAHPIPELVLVSDSPPIAPAPEPHQVTFYAGTVVSVILAQDLSTQKNRTGDTFLATLDRELVANGFVIADRGNTVEGRVVSSQPPGKVKGSAELAIQLTAIHTSDGQKVPILTDSFVKKANRGAGKEAARIGGAASIGAMIGGIAGGGAGAAIGAAIGGGAATGVVLATKGPPASLRVETRIPFRLRAPVTITERIY